MGIPLGRSFVTSFALNLYSWVQIVFEIFVEISGKEIAEMLLIVLGF